MNNSLEPSLRLNDKSKATSPNAEMSYENTDLSLSELSVPGPSTRLSYQPFSLLARPSQPPEPDPDISGKEEEGKLPDEVEEIVEEIVEDEEAQAKTASKTREERLRQDLFVLRKLNSGFTIYNEALAETRSSTERVSMQLKQTNALLDKYIDIISKSEGTSRLIFDERWFGADDDEATLERREREAQEKARREAEERAEAERQERERLEQVERERQERAEKERLEAEKKERLAIRAGYGGVRGVRGTRASTRGRGGNGVPRPASGVSRGKPLTSSTTGSAGRTSRPGSSASVRASANSRTGVR